MSILKRTEAILPVFIFIFPENVGLPERGARRWILSEHGWTHAVMQVSYCKKKEKICQI